MKAMPLSFENFQGEGVSDLDSSLFSLLHTKYNQQPDQNAINWELFSFNNKKQQPEQEEEEEEEGGKEEFCCYVGGGGGGGSNQNQNHNKNTDTYSVFESRKNSPSSLTSSTSTLSSSHSGGGGGGGGGASTGVAASNNEGTEKCGMGMEDWESVLSGSPSQEQSILRLIMGDVEDPSVGLNKILQTGNGSHDLEFNNGGFGIVDQAFGFQSSNNNNLLNTTTTSTSTNIINNIEYPVVNHELQTHNARVSSISNPNPLFSSAANNLFPVSLFQQHSIDGGGGGGGLDEKPQIYNPQMVLNHNQAHFNQNPAMFLPLSYDQLQKHYPMSTAAAAPPPPKRLNSGSLVGPNFLQVPKVPFLDSGQEMFLRRHQQQQQLLQQQQQRPTPAPPPTAATTAMGTTTKPRMPGDEITSQQLQQAIIDQLFKTAELIETGNQILAQEILARLNQQLSPIGKPFQRAAFYIKEAFQLLLHMNTSNHNQSTTLPPYNLIFKIGAYKSFSEISPILQFANFTCNQALLEVFDGFDRVHIIDFDIGYGGQWASLMQELVMRNNGAPSLKITAFVSPSTHDELELGFTRESLQHFATEINISFEIEIINLEAINSTSWPITPLHSSSLNNEAIAVNLPIGSFSNYPSFLPVVLRFVKQLSPKIVVSLDRGCDRTDSPFPHHMIHALQSYSGLLESLDAVNMNLDSLQKIERFLVQPGIEKIVLGRHRSIERMPPWRSLFMQSGFTPLTFSNFTESQAECLVQKTPIRGFHVEKRQSSLGLYWQRKELISASAWRC